MTSQGWPSDLEARIAKLVHDLRTPLTIAAGFADIVAGDLQLPEDKRTEYLRRISAATADMRAILDAERQDRLAQRLREEREAEG